MSLALIYHPIFLKHDTGKHHPERPSRIESIIRKLKKTKLMDKFNIVEPRAAAMEEISYAHDLEYIYYVKSACSEIESGNTYLDPDTPVSRDSFNAACFSAGSVLTGIELIMNGKFNTAFCMARPPGHHARKSRAMGFCIFNNIAIGAKYLEDKVGLTRIAILDWDVHHGNGTEEIFYKDNKVLYISLHQFPHYPGTGSNKDIGDDKGKGFNLNIPMPAGSGDNEYIAAFNNVALPRLREFKPEFILISAGFDGHKDDPLSSTLITENGYHEMTLMMKDIAHTYSNGRIVSVLEGGYNLFSLADSVSSHLQALL